MVLDRVEVAGSNPACLTLIIKALQKCDVFFYDWSALWVIFIKNSEPIFHQSFWFEKVVDHFLN